MVNQFYYHRLVVLPPQLVMVLIVKLSIMGVKTLLRLEGSAKLPLTKKSVRAGDVVRKRRPMDRGRMVGREREVDSLKDLQDPRQQEGLNLRMIPRSHDLKLLPMTN